MCGAIHREMRCLNCFGLKLWAVSFDSHADFADFAEHFEGRRLCPQGTY